MVANAPDSIERNRRLTGLPLTKLAEQADIPYKRLRRFFREDGPLTRVEMARLGTILDKAAGEFEPTPSTDGAQ